MNNKIMEQLETLEERIENIKWLITPQFSFKKGSIPDSLHIIRKSAGILGKGSLKGTSYENKIRREWETDSLKRIR